MARVTTWLFVESERASVEELSNLIGLQSDTVRRIGDPIRGRLGKISKVNLWQLDNKQEAPDEPEELLRHVQMGLRDVLSRISGHEEGFVAAGKMGGSGLLVGIVAATIPPIIFDAPLLKAIATLNADLQIDLVIDV